MAHPFSEHRQHKVERSRVSGMTKKYRASGGGVHCEEPEERKHGGKVKELDRGAQGKKAKRRADRVMRAKGGKVGHKKGATHVNVIVNGGDKGAMPVPMPPPAMAGPPPGPPPVAGLGGPPPGMPPGGPPPGMPPMPGRAHGGKVKRADGGAANHLNDAYSDQANNLNKGRARGGSVKSGPSWDEGKRLGTKVQHSDGKGTTNTKANLDRGRVVTFATGGGVVSFNTGGKVEAPGPGKGMGPRFEGGAAGGEARKEKMGRAERRYAKGMKEADGAR